MRRVCSLLEQTMESTAGSLAPRQSRGSANVAVTLHVRMPRTLRERSHLMSTRPCFSAVMRLMRWAAWLRGH